MAAQLDLFRPARRPATPKPRTMHVIDAGTAPDGTDVVHLRCEVCGHDSGWVKSRGVTAESKGRVCPSCKGTPKNSSQDATTAPPADLSH